MGPREDKPKSRTAAATAAAKRRAEERRADYLRERGWTCIAPGETPAARPNVAAGPACSHGYTVYAGKHPNGKPCEQPAGA